MRVVRAEDMPSLPPKTVYSETDGEQIGDFPGYGRDLFVTGRGSDPPAEDHWIAAELIPQPLARDMFGNYAKPRSLEVRRLFTVRPVGEGEYFYVYDDIDVGRLIYFLLVGE